MELRGVQAREAIAQDSLESAQRTLMVVEERFANGLGKRLDVALVYRKAVVEALNDVNDALVSYVDIQAQRDRLARFRNGCQEPAGAALQGLGGGWNAADAAPQNNLTKEAEWLGDCANRYALEISGRIGNLGMKRTNNTCATMTESAEMIEGKGGPSGGACVDTDFAEVDSGDKAMILLQTMICYLREKNILSRADIEVLRERVESRMEDARAEKAVRAEASGSADLPCDAAIARAAAREMRELDEYCGKRYGGKHRRRVN